jgi:amino acid adenylation domain-containing protein
VSDLNQRIERLSPEKRRLLESRIEERRRQFSAGRIGARPNPADPAPPSFIQERFWFLQEMEADAPIYNNPIILKIRGKLKIEVLQKSIAAVIQRHEALRTIFQRTDGDLQQIVQTQWDFQLPSIAIDRYPANRRAEMLARLKMDVIHHPFDLSRDLLLRGTVFCLQPDEYVLLLVIHHIASDFQTSNLLISEIGQAYDDFSQGAEPNLSVISIQYADYAIWQRKKYQGEFLAQKVGYWRQQLADCPAFLNLPTDRPRPPIQTYPGKRHPFFINAELTSEIRSLSLEERVTPFMILLTAFNVLLFRYSSQEDILLGSPVAGRLRSETEQMIGAFINTLVLRVNLAGNPTFKDLLQQVRTVTLMALSNQDLPFEMVVQELQPERNLSFSPFFQVMINYLGTQISPVGFTKLSVDREAVFNGKSIFDLTLLCWSEQTEIKGTFEFNLDLFDPATISKLSVHFQVLLQNFVTDPDKRISAVEMLTNTERQQLLYEWNVIPEIDPTINWVHRQFEYQVEQMPDAIALVFGEQSWTYQELNQKANQFARYLQAKGVGPDVLVGVYLPRSLEMVLAVLAIMKAGGAYIPLDSVQPTDRINQIITTAHPFLVLTDQSLSPQLSNAQIPIFCLDLNWTLVAQYDHENIATFIDPENLAYVIFTSGSTGAPKGVQICHRAVSNVIDTLARDVGINSNDYLLAVTTLTFDIAFVEIFSPLCYGATTEIISSELGKNGFQVLEKINQPEVTMMQATPATWQMVFDTGEIQNANLKILCVGDVMQPGLAKNLISSSAWVWNLYGPTETTIWSTKKQLKNETFPISIGRPIDNTQIFIVDQDRNLVPVGVYGELLIGGVGLARGYLNQPEMTAEKFIPHPFSSTPGDRLYRTGDFARFNRTGEIEFLGRKDNQVKLRGFRIELGEIEAALVTHSEIKDAVVITTKNHRAEMQLSAYIVLRNDSTLHLDEIRTFLGEKISDYMIPATILPVPSFPLTTSGKVDRNTLSTIVPPSNFPKTPFVPPQTPDEKFLAEIWKSVMVVAEIGIHDNFFEIGGHSLLATRVIARIRKKYNIELPLKTIFQNPTIAEMALVIKAAEISETKLKQTSILQVSRDHFRKKNNLK